MSSVIHNISNKSFKVSSSRNINDEALPVIQEEYLDIARILARIVVENQFTQTFRSKNPWQ